MNTTFYIFQHTALFVSCAGLLWMISKPSINAPLSKAQTLLVFMFSLLGIASVTALFIFDGTLEPQGTSVYQILAVLYLITAITSFLTFVGLPGSISDGSSQSTPSSSKSSVKMYAARPRE